MGCGEGQLVKLMRLTQWVEHMPKGRDCWGWSMAGGGAT